LLYSNRRLLCNTHSGVTCTPSVGAQRRSSWPVECSPSFRKRPVKRPVWPVNPCPFGSHRIRQTHWRLVCRDVALPPQLRRLLIHVSCRIRRSKDRTRSDPSRHWISSFLVTFLQACAVAPVLHSPEYSAACHGEFMFMRRWGSDTSRDSASAIGRNRCGLQIPIRQDLALAEVRSSWRAFDEHYSNVGTRVACLQIGCAPE